MSQSLELSNLAKYISTKHEAPDQIKTIVILESTENIVSFLKLENEIPILDFLIIATTPEVCFQLDKRNIKYRTCDAFVDINEITIIGNLNFLRVEEYCQIIDDEIRRCYPVFAEYSLKAASSNFQFFKILFDQITIKIKTLEKIIQNESPSHIITFSKPCVENYSEYIPFAGNEHLFDILLKLDGWSIEHISITQRSNIRTRSRKNEILTHILSRSKKWVRNSLPLLFSTTSVLHDSGGKTALTYLKNTLCNAFRSKKNVCLVGFGYDWNLLIPKLAQEHYSIIYWDIDRNQEKVQKKEEILLPYEQIRRLCRIGSIDLTDFISRKTLPRMINAVAIAADYPQILEAFYAKRNPHVMLYSTKGIFSESIAAYVAKSRKIPVVSWQHGAAGFFANYPIQKYTEIAGSDVHLVWGNGVKQQIEREWASGDCKIVPTGSISLEKNLFATQSASHTTKTVVYVTTNYFYNSLYIGYSHRILDIPFWVTQQSIIDGLGSLGIPAVFKIHPSTPHPEHFQDYILWRKITNVSIIQNEKTFPSLIDESEIIIIDFPSTTLLQAIVSKKTIFVLLTHVNLTTNAKTSLLKRAYCYECPADLISAIKKYLQGDDLDQHPNNEDREFLEQFCICKKDGDVEDRVIHALNEIIQK